MGESIQEQLRALSGQIRRPEISAEEAISSAESPSHVVVGSVAGEMVHARGGVLINLEVERQKRSSEVEVGKVNTVHGSPETELGVADQLLRKGDIFTNPETGARQIIEGIRREGATKMVLFTNELEPGVRAEPGEVIRQLPFENFEVQRKAGGFMEWKPVYEQEFDEIFDTCQEAFEAVNVLELQRTKEHTPESLEVVTRVEELAADISVLEEMWDIAKGMENQKAAIKEKLDILDRLKETVALLPESLTQSYALLKKVQDEWKHGHRDDEEEPIEDGVVDNKQKTKKGSIWRNHRETLRKEDGAGKGRVRDMEGLNVAVSGEKVAEKTRREARRGEVHQPMIDFHAYRTSTEELETLWSDETIPLAAWIDTIRQEQADLAVVINELERLGGIGRWEEALESLGAGYQQLTLKADRESVAQYLDNLDTIFIKRKTIKKKDQMAEAEKATRTQRFVEERPKLKEILFKYYGILRTGEAVINELRQAALQRNEIEGEVPASPKRNERREQSHERMPNNNKIQSMLFEARVLLADWSELRQSVDPKKRTVFDQAVKKRLGITRLPQFDFQVRWIETQSERDDWRTSEGREMFVKLDDQLRKYGLIVAACRREVGKFRKKSKKPGRPTATVGSRSLIVEQASKSMGEVWENTNSKLKEELLTGLQALETQKNEDAESAFEILKDSGIPPEDQGTVVIQTLAPAFNEEVKRMLRYVNIQLPPAEMAEFTQGLLSVNPTKENDDVGK